MGNDTSEQLAAARVEVVRQETRIRELEAEVSTWKQRCAEETLAWTESVKERDRLAAKLDAIQKLANDMKYRGKVQPSALAIVLDGAGTSILAILTTDSADLLRAVKAEVIELVAEKFTLHGGQLYKTLHEYAAEYRTKQGEAEKVAEYHELVAGGLSDSEARGTVWPEHGEQA